MEKYVFAREFSIKDIRESFALANVMFVPHGSNDRNEVKKRVKQPKSDLCRIE